MREDWLRAGIDLGGGSVQMLAPNVLRYRVKDGDAVAALGDVCTAFASELAALKVGRSICGALRFGVAKRGCAR